MSNHKNVPNKKPLIVPYGVEIYNRFSKKIMLLHQSDPPSVVQANFAGMDLRGADFSGLNLRGANFEKANLTDANFHRALLHEANFKQAHMGGAHICFCRGIRAVFSQSFMGGVCGQRSDFSASTFDGAYLAHADFHRCTIHLGSFRRATLRQINLNKADVAGSDFTDAVMSWARMKKCVITGCKGNILYQKGLL